MATVSREVMILNRPIVCAGTTVAVILDETVLSATLVATTEKGWAVVTLGAWKRPLLEIVPMLALHTTAVLLVFWNTAENCWVS